MTRIDAAARELANQQLQWKVRAHILPYLPPSEASAELWEALSREEQENPTLSVEASAIIRIAALAPLLPPTMLNELFTAAAALEDPDELTPVLLALLPHANASGLPYPEQLVEQARTAAMAIPDTHKRVTTLVQLAPNLPDAPARELYAVALADTTALMESTDLNEDDASVETLLSVVAAVPSDRLTPLLALARRLPTDPDRIQWLPDHLGFMGASGDAPTRTSLAPSWGRRATLLGALAARWPADSLNELSDVAQRIGDTVQQVDTLLALRGLRTVTGPRRRRGRCFGNRAPHRRRPRSRPRAAATRRLARCHEYRRTGQRGTRH